MKNSRKYSSKPDQKYFTFGGLIHLTLFLLAISLRIAASARIPLNAYESSLVLQMTDQIVAEGVTFSLIETLLIRATFFVFGPSRLGVRIWAILPGSLLVLLPYFCRKKIGINLSLLIALLVSFEPFLLTNSLQFGSNILAVFGLSVLLLGFINDKRWTRIIASGIILLSGRGLLPALIMLGALVLFDNIWMEDDRIFRQNQNQGANPLVSWLDAALVIFLFLTSIVLTRSDLADVFSTISAFFPSHSQDYVRTASLAGLPIVLVSYSPLFIVMFVAFVVRFHHLEKNTVTILAALAILSAVWLVVMPKKMYLDLVWISLPMAIGGAYFMSRMDGAKRNTRDIVILLAVLVVCASAVISLLQFIHQGRQGFSQTNALINILTLVLVIGFGFVSFISFGQGRQFIRLFGVSSLIVLAVLQFSFSLQAVGYSRNMNAELMWSGSLMEPDLLQDLVDNQANMKQFVDERIIIGVEKGLSPQISWVLKNYELSYIDAGFYGPVPFKMILTSQPEIDVSGGFIGQSISVDAGPKWIETPLSSLFDYDYWSWLFFRNSTTERTTKYFWYAMD